MKIAESNVNLSAQRSYQENRSSSLRVQVEQRTATTPPRPEVTLSENGKSQALQEIDIEKAVDNDPQMRLIRQLIEMIMGHPINLRQTDGSDTVQTESPAQSSEFPIQTNVPAVQENNTTIDYHAIHTETESVQFQASGIIRTSDGVEIKFDTELSMSRSFSEEISVNATTGSPARAKKDPLVLNYAAPAATLSDSTFTFDLDADGKKENINQLNSGSAFLALDHNGDGKVNNGRELFGTQNGDGFADLAQHDSDGNGWIDENDAVFIQLKLWIKDAGGTDKLLDLKSMGIGAIYLGNAKADFSLNNAQNQQLGQARSTGIYLMENGSGGTMQQIDLVA